MTEKIFGKIIEHLYQIGDSPDNAADMMVAVHISTGKILTAPLGFITEMGAGIVEIEQANAGYCYITYENIVMIELLEDG